MREPQTNPLGGGCGPKTPKGTGPNGQVTAHVVRESDTWKSAWSLPWFGGSAAKSRATSAKCGGETPPSLSLAGSGPSIWRSDGREPLVAYYYYYNWLMGGQAERSDPGPPLLVCVAGQWGRATWQAVEDLLWYHEFFGCELVHACAVLKSPSLFLISFRPLRKVPLCLSYSPTSLIRHSITRQPRYNVTNSVNQTFLLESTSMIRPWHCWLDTPWPPNCCIVEVLYAYMALGLGKVG